MTLSISTICRIDVLSFDFLTIRPFVALRYDFRHCVVRHFVVRRFDVHPGKQPLAEDDGVPMSKVANKVD